MSKRRKRILAAARAALPSALAYGLGYGVARTALEHALDKGLVPPGVQKYGPLALGGVAAYAGYKADRATQKHIDERAAK